MIYFLMLLAWVYACGQMADTSALGVRTGGAWWTLFTYSFVHLSLLHLVSNAALLVFYWRRVRLLPRWWTLCVLVSSVLLAGLLAARETPTVGASALVMAMAGVLTATFPRRQWPRMGLTVGLSFAATAMWAAQVNTAIHVYAYLFAFVASLLARRASHEGE